MKVAVVVITVIMGLAAAIASTEQHTNHHNNDNNNKNFVSQSEVDEGGDAVVNDDLKARQSRVFLEDVLHWPGELSGSQDFLEETQEGEEEPEVSQKVVEDRDGRKFTIWSTNFSTLTVTSTSYLAGTTVTASALCSAPGVTAGCFGKNRLWSGGRLWVWGLGSVGCGLGSGVSRLWSRVQSAVVWGLGSVSCGLGSGSAVVRGQSAVVWVSRLWSGVSQLWSGESVGCGPGYGVSRLWSRVWGQSAGLGSGVQSAVVWGLGSSRLWSGLSPVSCSRVWGQSAVV
ncbi:hypothetical protein Hamer_G008638 [Homarus americanus]|uniref:Uncharacterized protein n=1 Tax=Homarus americanus TaxID=6706 RepID=A0A8J5N4I0_HOMAM|nr:hypothetical protein Hamer_G008638 [Homarus americanus]